MGDLHDWNTEVHLGEKKLGERVQKDTSCQKWPFLRADCRNEECWKFWGEYVTDKVPAGIGIRLLYHSRKPQAQVSTSL